MGILQNNIHHLPDLDVAELLEAMMEADARRGYMQPISQEHVDQFRMLFERFNLVLAKKDLPQLPLDDEGILQEIRAYNMSIFEKRISFPG